VPGPPSRRGGRTANGVVGERTAAQRPIVTSDHICDREFSLYL
jgi:hypothetical protein